MLPECCGRRWEGFLTSGDASDDDRSRRNPSWVALVLQPTIQCVSKTAGEVSRHNGGETGGGDRRPMDREFSADRLSAAASTLRSAEARRSRMRRCSSSTLVWNARREASSCSGERHAEGSNDDGDDDGRSPPPALPPRYCRGAAMSSGSDACAIRRASDAAVDGRALGDVVTAADMSLTSDPAVGKTEQTNREPTKVICFPAFSASM